MSTPQRFIILESGRSAFLTPPRSEHSGPNNSPFRLLHTETGKLVNWPGDDTEYAILSHVWCKPPGIEVTWNILKDTSVPSLMEHLDGLKQAYKRIADSQDSSEKHQLEVVEDTERTFDLKFRLGNAKPRIQDVLDRITKELLIDNQLRKIESAMKAAKDLGLAFIWVDTCCMDKSNSTELMESICSMGAWYSHASWCLVYLADVSESTMGQAISRAKADGRKPEWSTRGWTMQEIALCKAVKFFNMHWIGLEVTPTDILRQALPLAIRESMDASIHDFCNVPRELYCTGGKTGLAASYVFHYAGRRKTTKPEDQVYSLMGILAVKIPILYGEGEESAISRMVDELIRSKSDVSVFNWTGIDSGSRLPGRSLYPAQLKAFSEKGSPIPINAKSPITMSNVGVYTHFEILPAYPVFTKVQYPRGLPGLLREVETEYPNVDCVVKLKGFLFWDDSVEFTPALSICCPLPTLRREAEYLRKADRPIRLNEKLNRLPGSWVLVRFDRCTTDWFLCALELASVEGFVGRKILSEKIVIKQRLIGDKHRVPVVMR